MASPHLLCLLAQLNALEAEMDAWWSHHSAIFLGDYTRDKVEDYTDCNPLLLMSFIEGGKFNLECEGITRKIRHLFE